MFICMLPYQYGSYLRVTLKHKQDTDITLNFECKQHALSAIIGADRVNSHSALLPHKLCHLVKEKHNSLYGPVRSFY